MAATMLSLIHILAGKDKIRINFSHEKKNMVIEGMKIFSAIIREMVE